MKATEDILTIIGNTPLIKLKKVTDGLNVNVYAKCEYLNPSGSIKDRMALRMVEEAEKEGLLRPGGTIIEQTSGNTGPALAFVGNVKGYGVRLFLPSRWTGTYNPTERIKIMECFGAKVETFSLTEYGEMPRNLADDQAAFNVAIGMKKCSELERDNPKTWWANQMCNIQNVSAHRDTTAKEIVEQLGGDVDVWVASVGTGGTLLGVAEALRKENPSVRVVGVEPTDSSLIECLRSGKLHRLLEALHVPRMKFLIETMLEKGLPDEIVTITDEDARKMAHRLCREEGLFCGMSSGANVLAAIQLAKKLGKDSKVVTVLVDRRDRYYSEYPAEHYVV